MRIVVLIKQTFDTEEKIALQNGAVLEAGVKFVVNPYDEYALEEGIRLKERYGGSVTTVTVGNERSVDALRTALALGADEAVLIEEPEAEPDEAVLSRILAAYLRSNPFDIALGGNFSVDRGSGQVAIRVAQLLDIPHVGAITKLDIDPDAVKAVATRDAEGDDEIVEVPLPALFTAQQGLNDPRYPTLPGIMKAKKKPLVRVSPASLGLSAEQLAPATVATERFLPPPRQAGRILQGDLPSQVKELAALLCDHAKLPS